MQAEITVHVKDIGTYSVEEIKQNLERYVQELVSSPKVDYAPFFGKLSLSDDPMEIQKKVRGEWT